MKTAPDRSEATTATGMRLRRIDAGSFLMGNDRALPDALLSPSCFRYGDFDEVPVHRVTITRPFYLAECQVTNAQYEMFDPAHRDQHLLHCLAGDEEGARRRMARVAEADA